LLQSRHIFYFLLPLLPGAALANLFTFVFILITSFLVIKILDLRQVFVIIVMDI